MALDQFKSPFEVSISDLQCIDAARAVDLFQELILSEALQCGVPVTSISVPKAITTADGGVDAELNIPNSNVKYLGLIRGGLTRYQIKTGSFSATTEGDLKDLILRPSKKSEKKLLPEHLNPRVKACLDRKGTFIVVLFGSDAVGKSEDYGVNQLIELLTRIDSQYSDAKIEIIRANQICASITAISPGLALQLNSLGGAMGFPFNNINFLEKHCDLEIDRYVETKELSDLAAAIKGEANNLNGFTHIRVLGDAGAGKTHLVYRALKDSNVSGHVLYCPCTEKLSDSPAFNQLVTRYSKSRVVLVADECDFDDAVMLSSRFKNTAEHFLLITIYNQISNDEALGPTAQLIKVPSLDKSAMAEIFAGYGIQKDRQAWLTDLLEGSPRAAHMIGEMIQAQPEIEYVEHFSTLDSFWDKFVCYPDTPDSIAGSDKLAVARCIGLFRKVSWAGYVSESGKSQVEKLIRDIADLAPNRISSLVKLLQQRRIIQGNTTLYISPKLLHIKLWRDWWDLFGHIVDENWLRTSFEGKMRDWFHEMFEYARESKAATRTVEHLLSIEGPLAKLEYFEEQGMAKLFFALAQADSKAALRRLQFALEQASLLERTAFKVGRQEVVHGLERLAVPESNFLGAVHCLLLLAEAENASWSNNATGVFISMFTLGYGKLAASEYSPIDKLSYLKELITSENLTHRSLAITALTESLKPFMTRMDIGETAGLRRLPDRWMPKTYDELWAAYRAHVELLYETYNLHKDDLGLEAAQGIINNLRSLLTIPPLGERIIELFEIFASEPRLRAKVTEAIENCLHYDGSALPQPLLHKLTLLRDELTERTFHDRLVRYAGMQLLEDSFDDQGQHREGHHPSLVKLRDEVMQCPENLISELSWLVSDEAKNGYLFGTSLGEVDEMKLWGNIADAWVNSENKRSDFFVGGYLAGSFSAHPDDWERAIMRLLDRTEIVEDVVPLIWRSGMTVPVAYRLLDYCKKGYFDPKLFRLFGYGGRVKDLPSNVFEEVLELLLKSNENANIDAALELIQARRRLRDEDENLIQLLKKTLNHDFYIKGTSGVSHLNNMREYYWTEGAKFLLKSDPQSALELGLNCIQNFGADGSVTDSYYSRVSDFLDRLLTQFPSQMWEAIHTKLEQVMSASNYHLLEWLRGGKSRGESTNPTGFKLINASEIIEWITLQPDERAPLIARYCSPEIEPVGNPTLARLILEHFGGRNEVRSAMHGNFWTAFFGGRPSDYYKQRQEWAKNTLISEINPNVRRWLQEEIEQLESTIQIELDREEADDFYRS